MSSVDAESAMTSLSAEALRDACVRLLAALDVQPGDAELMTDVHIDSELRGERSHGVHILLIQARKIMAGSVRAKPKITVLRDEGATAVFDAHHSIGQVVGAYAMQQALARADKFGVGIVGVRSATSYTSAKYYPLMAVKKGMIGITYANSRKMIPPQGGAEAVMGNNPMSIAAPAGSEFPFVLDMACSVAKEKIFQASEEARPIPLDWALDENGEPTTDPNAAIKSQVLLPFGGHKAAGMAMAHEVLTSVLFGGDLFTGAGTGFRPLENPMQVTQYFQAINIGFVTEVQAFRERMDEMIRVIRGSKRRQGVDHIFVPGERGFLEMQRQQREGMRISWSTIDEMRQLADELSIQLPTLDQLARP